MFRPPIKDEGVPADSILKVNIVTRAPLFVVYRHTSPNFNWSKFFFKVLVFGFYYFWVTYDLTYPEIYMIFILSCHSVVGNLIVKMDQLNYTSPEIVKLLLAKNPHKILAE